MKKCIFLSFLIFFWGTILAQNTHESVLPGSTGQKPAIEYNYFPSRMHAFIWKNWTVVPKSRLAKVLGASEKQVEEIAISMGLPQQVHVQKEWLTARGYITVLRRNWHILPYEQLTTLLGMTKEELAWKLKEDDFLFVKLGNIKPFCSPLKYQKPSKEMNLKAREISTWINELGDIAFAKETPRFDFINDFHTINQSLNNRIQKSDSNKKGFELRMIFPYFAEFGDPLMNKELSSYPEGMFQRLSEVGVNGIWIHSVLRMFVHPKDGFPGDKNANQRIEGLQKLVNRAAKYGIKIYLYMNEPRSMEQSFFASNPKRKEWGGAIEGDLQAFCVSNPEVKNWLTSSTAHLFKQVKGLGGVFSITASENYTTCVSHDHHKECKYCKEHSYAELIVEVNKAIEEGVHQGDPNAKVIVWDWGWKEGEVESIIRNLPKKCWFMSVSEWDKPIERGGVKSVVGEYSISSVGPSERTKQHWKWARERGLKTIAKVQVNASWEFSAVPALPVMDLVAQHAENLSKESINGIMLSWSLGGYPSANLNLFQNYRQGKKEECLNELAESYYGKAAVSDIRQAWTSCSEGFKEFPYTIGTLYTGPQHIAPSNPLYIKPTDYAPTMVGMPYDAVKTWCSFYPLDIWVNQMKKVAKGFAQGSKYFDQAEKKVKGEFAEHVHTEWIRSEVTRIHLSSSAQQALFYEARNRWLKENDSQAIDDMKTAAMEELKLLKEILPLVKEESTIAYESSNHYFYLPIDLLEKYISIQFTLKWLKTL